MTMNEYIKKYPWLRGYDPYPEDSTENPCCSLEWLPRGWVEAFGEEMCEEIDAALKKTTFYDEAYVSEAKEKYASLRMCIYPSNEEVENILLKYETISEHVCMLCPAVDTPMLNLSRWLATYCRSCYAKVNSNGRHKPYDEVVDGEAKMPDVIRMTRYSKKGNEHFEIDISETTNKIRENWKKRQEAGEKDNFAEWEDHYYGA